MPSAARSLLGSIYCKGRRLVRNKYLLVSFQTFHDKIISCQLSSRLTSTRPRSCPFNIALDFLLQILKCTLLNNSFQVFQLPLTGKFFPDNTAGFHGALDRIGPQKADTPQDERQHINRKLPRPNQSAAGNTTSITGRLYGSGQHLATHDIHNSCPPFRHQGTFGLQQNLFTTNHVGGTKKEDNPSATIFRSQQPHDNPPLPKLTQQDFQPRRLLL